MEKWEVWEKRIFTKNVKHQWGYGEQGALKNYKWKSNM